MKKTRQLAVVDRKKFDSVEEAFTTLKIRTKSIDEEQIDLIERARCLAQSAIIKAVSARQSSAQMRK